MMKISHSVYIISLILVVLAFVGILLVQTRQQDIPILTRKAIFDEPRERETFTYIEPENNSREDALAALINAQGVIEELQELGLSTQFLHDTLLTAQRAYIGENANLVKVEEKQESDETKKNYFATLIAVAEATPTYELEQQNDTKVFMLTQLIVFKKQQGLRILDTLSLLHEKEQALSEDGIETNEVVPLLTSVRQSFDEERYGEAEDFLREADTLLTQMSIESRRVKGLVELSKNFFERYFLYILTVVIIITFSTRPAFKKYRIRRAKKKLESLQLEQRSLLNVIKKAQEDCFKEQIISLDTYKIRVERYKRRLAEIKHIIPILEAIVSGKKMVKKEKPRGILKIK